MGNKISTQVKGLRGRTSTTLLKEKGSNFHLDITIDTSLDKNNNNQKSFTQFNLFHEIIKNKLWVFFFLFLVGMSYLSYYINYITSYFVMDIWQDIPHWLQNVLNTILQFLYSIGKYIFDNTFNRMTFFLELLLVYLFIHRLIGYGLGWFLRKKLDYERTGKFNIHIEWISLRLGIDLNMIVIHGIEWRNPPGFKHTPYLLKINEVSVIIDLLSIYKALLIGTSMVIKDITISKINLHLEKYTNCKTPDHEVEIEFDDNQSEASDFILQEELVDSLLDYINSFFSSNNNDFNNHISEEIKLKNGVLNLSAALGATNNDEQKNLITKLHKNIPSLSGVYDYSMGIISTMNDTAKNLNPMHFLSSASSVIKNNVLPKTDLFKGMDITEKTDDEIREKFLEYDEDKSGFLDGIELSKLCSALGASLTEEQMDKALTVLDENNDGEIAYEEFLDWWKTKNKEKYKRKIFGTTKKTKSSMLGIPYTFIINHLHFDHLDVDAQDILQANHTKSLSSASIKLKLFHMFTADLTLPPDRSIKLQKGKKAQRRGMFLDDILWKVISKIVTELILHNSISMAILFTSAAASNTASVVQGIKNVGSKVPNLVSRNTNNKLPPN